MTGRPESVRTPIRSDIEGLRAIAVLGVVAFHAGVPLLPGGYVGVDVFYVISGYLITLLMLRDLASTPAPGFRAFLADFYARRFRRILPASTLVLVATLCVAFLIQNPIENATIADEAMSAALFFANAHFAQTASDYFADASRPSPFTQYWSLSLEEQFYFVWPIVVFALLGGRRSRARTLHLGFLVGIIVASFAVCLYWMNASPIRAFYHLPARAWELGIGALIAVESDRFRGLSTGLRETMALLGLAAIAASMCLLNRESVFPGWTAVPPVIGTAFVIAAGSGGGTPTGTARWMLSTTPMQLLGRYSYALYLWHWPILVLRVEHFKWAYASWPMRAALMLVVAIPASVITYHLIENPTRKAKRLQGKPNRSLAFGGLLIVLSLSSSALFARMGSMGQFSSNRAAVVTSGALADTIVPTDFVPVNLVPSLAKTRESLRYVNCDWPCQVGPKDAVRRVVLFGNSHAGHWGTAFEGAANALKVAVTIEGRGGCASYPIFADEMAPDKRVECDQRREAMYQRIRASPPDLVVLSNLTGAIFEKHPEQWEAAVREAIRRIPKQTRVVIFAESPHSKRSVPLCLIEHLEANRSCDVEWPMAINARLQAIAAESGAVFVDLRELFCTSTRCPTVTEDHLIYADADHITVEYSRARVPWVAKLLSLHLGLEKPALPN